MKEKKTAGRKTARGTKQRAVKTLKTNRQGAKTAAGTSRRAVKKVKKLTKEEIKVRAEKARRRKAKASKEADRRLMSLRKNLIADIEADLGKFAGGTVKGASRGAVTGKLRIIFAFLQAFFPMMGNKKKNKVNKNGTSRRQQHKSTKAKDVKISKNTKAHHHTDRNTLRLPVVTLPKADATAVNAAQKEGLKGEEVSADAKFSNS